MCPLLPIWISKNICKNTKPCEFTFVKNKELLALFLQQILRTWKMPECLKLKNIQSLNWILLVLIKKSAPTPCSNVFDTFPKLKYYFLLKRVASWVYISERYPSLTSAWFGFSKRCKFSNLFPLLISRYISRRTCMCNRRRFKNCIKWIFWIQIQGHLLSVSNSSLVASGIFCGVDYIYMVW